MKVRTDAKVASMNIYNLHKNEINKCSEYSSEPIFAKTYYVAELLKFSLFNGSNKSNEYNLIAYLYCIPTKMWVVKSTRGAEIINH